jgi:polyisoprenoid-binding protein YceI
MTGTETPSSEPATSPRRRSRVKIALLAGAGLVVVAAALFAGAYFLFFNSDSPPPLKLSQKSGPAPSSALAGTWTPSSGEAGYRVREKLAFLPAQSDAVGRTKTVTGTFALADDGSKLTASKVSLTVDVSTLTSNEARRDNRIRTSGLETDRFPSSTFVADGPIDVPSSARNGTAVTVTAHGALTIHGVTKDVDIPIQARASGSTIELVGSYKFPMSQFNIEPPSIAGFVSVESDATMEFKLDFVKKA